MWLEVDLGFILRYRHLYTLVGKKPEQLNNFPNGFYNSCFSWVIFYASGISRTDSYGVDKKRKRGLPDVLGELNSSGVSPLPLLMSLSKSLGGAD